MHLIICTKIEDQRLYLQRIFGATLMGSWEINIILQLDINVGT